MFSLKKGISERDGMYKTFSKTYKNKKKEIIVQEKDVKTREQMMSDSIKTMENDKNWVFTDLIKCFVWKGRDKSKKLKSSKNKETAIEYCQKYLDKQIHTLRPKKILSLGNTVTKEYFNLNDCTYHGSVHKLLIK